MWNKIKNKIKRLRLIRLSERVTVAIGVILDETNKVSVAMEKQADRVAEQWCL